MSVIPTCHINQCADFYNTRDTTNYSIKVICNLVGISKTTFYKYLRTQGIEIYFIKQYHYENNFHFCLFFTIFVYINS